MIMRDIVIREKMDYTVDVYGGKTGEVDSTNEVIGKVSIKNNELKPKANGYDFYRVLTLITNNSTVVIGDTITHSGVSYTVDGMNPLAKFKVYTCNEV